ncbi:MAG: hypothetical protein K1X67_12835, partial [Fimbriimonadaceae bacterium]|nr:hypothetical protein [Fimbriimonadaceae bacterium]
GARIGLRGARIGLRGARIGLRGARIGLRGARIGLRGARIGLRGARIGLRVLMPPPSQGWRRCRWGRRGIDDLPDGQSGIRQGLPFLVPAAIR